MPPRRQVPTQGASTPPAEPEQAGTSEISELRALVARIAESNRRQERQIEQLLARGKAPPPTVLEDPAPPVVPFVSAAPSSSSGARRMILDTHPSTSGKRKRPASDVDRHADSRRRPRLRDRCIFCRGRHLPHTCALRKGRCFRCGRLGHIRATCPSSTSKAPPPVSAPIAPPQRSRSPLQQQFQQQQTRPLRCIFCGGQHFPSTCEQRWGRCYQCGQLGHRRVTCPLGTAAVPLSASVLTTFQLRPGVSPTDPLTGPDSFPHSSGERQPSLSGQDGLAQAADSVTADHRVAGIFVLRILVFTFYLHSSILVIC